jgi:putative endonuclease
MTQAPPGNTTKDWFVYILRCGNGALYTGVTTDVLRRTNEHKDIGRLCARFTRAFAPVELVYSCRIGEKHLAYRIEYRIKRLPRSKKALIVTNDFSKKTLIDFLELDAKA